MKRWIAYIVLVAVLCCACSRSRSIGHGTESTDTGTTERAAHPMENETVMERITEKLGEGVEGIAQAIKTENDNGRLFVEIRVFQEKKADAEAWLDKTCGEGDDAGTRRLPAFKNSICDDLRSMQPVKAYTKFRQGKNGAKTETTEIMTAIDEENTFFIYILGV